VAWEPGQHHKTLLIQRVGSKFKIYAFQRVRNREGTEYFEPVPSDSAELRAQQYDAVEYFDHPGTRRGENANALSLTAKSADEAVTRNALG
jgi:hypothetical protein